MTAPALETRHVTKRFQNQVAVDDLSCAVEFGEVVGLLGANGAGKTTTIRMLAGLLEPTAGQVRLLGRRPARSSRRRLGYVPQGLGLYRDMTVAENLSFSAGAFGVQSSELTDELESAADRLVGDLPLGLQRQLAFLAAQQHAPDVLILDEPTSGVGPLGAARLWDHIRVESERGVGVLVSTHSMQEARQCDRLLLMADGRLVASGRETDIVGDMTVVEVAADEWNASFETLARDGALVMLDGRLVRVIDRSASKVDSLLRSAGLSAEIRVVSGTIDERMALLSLKETVA
jgi:ABC-2 type transport system ATP-binding protein/ribosome-dependent ATPase